MQLRCVPADGVDGPTTQVLAIAEYGLELPTGPSCFTLFKESIGMVETAAGTGKASSLRLSSDAAGTNALPLKVLLRLLCANSEELEQAADGTFTV